VFLDYPEKAMMFGLHLLVQRRSGAVLRLGPPGRTGLFGLPEIAAELYRTARVLRLFTLGGRREVRAGSLARLAQRTAVHVRAAVAGGTPLLD
jgi:hypothetical protein